MEIPSIFPDNDHRPTFGARALVFILIFIPWLLTYEYVVWLGPQAHAFITYLPGEWNWPVWQWTELLYVSPYLLVTLAPVVAPTNRILRRFVFAGVIAMVVVNAMFLTVPAISPPRPFHPTNFCGQMMVTDRWLDRNNGAASFPSFHVIWAFLGAAVLADWNKKLRVIWWTWAAAVAASCVLTGMHSLVDIVAGFVTFLLVYNYPRLLPRTMRQCRKSAPSSTSIWTPSTPPSSS